MAWWREVDRYPPGHSRDTCLARWLPDANCAQFSNCLWNAPYGDVTALRFSPDSKSLAVALSFRRYTLGDLEQFAVPVLEIALGGDSGDDGQGTHRSGCFRCLVSRRQKGWPRGSMDTTILLWGMNRPVGADPTAGKSAKRLDILWADLANDGVSAYDAVLALAKRSNECVPFLEKRLKPVEPVSNEQVARWIDDLDSGSFFVREKASAKLAVLHELARPALQKALVGRVSVEARRRLMRLVGRLDSMRYSPGLMQELRSVEILERIGSKEARRLLEKLAAGAAEAPLTVEAKASLARLKARRVGLSR